jgi:hypothetical protein
MNFHELLELKYFGKLDQKTIFYHANTNAEFSNKWLVHAIRSECSQAELASAIAASLKWDTQSLRSLNGYLDSLIEKIKISHSNLPVETSCLLSQEMITNFCHDKQKELLKKLNVLSLNIGKKKVLDDNKFTCNIAMPTNQISEILNSCAPQLKSVSLFGNEGGDSKDENIRNNTHFPTPLPNDSMALALLENLLAKAAEEPISFSEPPVILRYQTGQYYKWHYDYIHPHTQEIENHINQFGQRTKTAIFYFNDNFIGGETEFKKPYLSVSPEKNKVLIFKNCNKGFARDPSSIHRGNTVTEGDKWIMTLWFRNKPFWLRTGLL